MKGGVSFMEPVGDLVMRRRPRPSPSRWTPITTSLAALALAVLGSAGSAGCRGSHDALDASSDASLDARAFRDAAPDDARTVGDDGARADTAPHDSEPDAADAEPERLSPPQCPPAALEPCPQTSALQWQVLLDAANFGEGARLSAMGDNAVLVEGGDEPWRVVRLGREGEPAVTWRFPDGDWVGLDVMAVYRDGFPDVYALACEASLASCRLLGGEQGMDGGALELTEIADTVVPKELEPRGVVFDYALEAPCVFGNGLLCFDSEWTTAIADDGDLKIVEISPGQAMIAVGEHGRWWTRDLDDSSEPQPWMEQPPVEGSKLRGGTLRGERAAVYGAQGWWLWEQGELLSCTVADGVWWLGFSAGSFTTVANGSGQVAAYAFDDSTPRNWRWCELQQLALENEPILGQATIPCGASANPRVLTPSRVMGTDLCITL